MQWSIDTISEADTTEKKANIMGKDGNAEEEEEVRRDVGSLSISIITDGGRQTREPLQIHFDSSTHSTST